MGTLKSKLQSIITGANGFDYKVVKIVKARKYKPNAILLSIICSDTETETD